MEIRWKQRFGIYVKALDKLSISVHRVTQTVENHSKGIIHSDPILDDLIKQGILHRFKYTHELAWNVMKDFLQYSGIDNVTGSRDAIRAANENGLIQNAEVWMVMIRSRNKTSHTYHEATADEVFWNIVKDYYPEFVAFKEQMLNIQESNR